MHATIRQRLPLLAAGVFLVVAVAAAVLIWRGPALAGVLPGHASRRSASSGGSGAFSPGLNGRIDPSRPGSPSGPGAPGAPAPGAGSPRPRGPAGARAAPPRRRALA